MDITPHTASFTVNSSAKINLFLHVTGRRSDGYHLIETVFQFLDLNDTLEFIANQTGIVSRIDCHGYPLPEEDLILKAARLLSDSCPELTLPGVEIKLTKHIPPGAGLGGGSSNAAATLTGLNQFWNLQKTREELLHIAAKLGADVPVFVYGESCWATGIGDILTPYWPEEKWYCLYMPDVLVPTAAIYNHPQLIRNHPAHATENGYPATTTNDLEPVTRMLFGEVDVAFQLLGQFGEPRMNGSGASVFLECKSRSHAESIRQALPVDGRCIVTQSRNRL